MPAPNILVNSEGRTWTQYPIYRERPVVVNTSVSHSVPDPSGQGGADHTVVIDAAAPNTDKAHLFLSGVPATDEFFIRCNNPGQLSPEVFWVNGDGDIKCNQVTSPYFNSEELAALVAVTATLSGSDLLQGAHSKKQIWILFKLFMVR